MAQQKKLTPENLEKELAAVKEKQAAAEEMRADAWKKLDEADVAKQELQRTAILLETAKNMLGEPIKAQIAYAKGLADGRGVNLEDPEKSLSEIISQFKQQDKVDPAPVVTPVAKGRPPTPKAEVTPPTDKPKRKRRTKAEMEAAKAAEAAGKVIPDVSPAAAMAALTDPSVVVDEDYFDDGEYDD
jgi:hypothetical protein